jgi:GNAT superfamily N-acetyltransferase
MIIRPAAPADLPACLAVDASYQTSQVWQMRVQRGDVMGEGEEGLFIAFRPTRLPRPIVLTPPGQKDRLAGGWQRRAFTLVLEDDGAICGYLGVQVSHGQQLGWIDVMAVTQAKRQEGWSRRLLEEAIAWGHVHGLRALVLETQARNAPAITLAQQLGFSFSGYHEQQYGEGDVALFFAFPLR